MTKDIIVDPKNVLDEGKIAKQGIAALRIQQGYDTQTRESFSDERVYTLESESTGNAWTGSEGKNWVLQKKAEDPSTDSLNADLVHHRAKQIAIMN